MLGFIRSFVTTISRISLLRFKINNTFKAFYKQIADVGLLGFIVNVLLIQTYSCKKNQQKPYRATNIAKSILSFTMLH